MSDRESDLDEGDSSDEADPWLNAGAQPGVPANPEHGISEAEVSNGHAAEYYQERNTHDPNSWEYVLALAEQDDAVGHRVSGHISVPQLCPLPTSSSRRHWKIMRRYSSEYAQIWQHRH